MAQHSTGADADSESPPTEEKAQASGQRQPLDWSDEISKAKGRIDLLAEALQTERVHREALEEDISKCKQQTEAVQAKLNVEQAAREAEVGMLFRDLNSLWLAISTGNGDALGTAQASEYFEKACQQVDLCRKMESEAQEREDKLDLVAGQLIKMSSAMQTHFVEVLERVEAMRGETMRQLAEVELKLGERCDHCRQLIDKVAEDAARCTTDLTKVSADVQGLQAASQAGRLPSRASFSPSPPQERRLDEVSGAPGASPKGLGQLRPQPAGPQDILGEQVPATPQQASTIQVQQQSATSPSAASLQHRHPSKHAQQQSQPSQASAGPSQQGAAWMRNVAGREQSVERHDPVVPHDRSPTTGGQPKSRVRAGNTALSPIASRADLYLQGAGGAPSGSDALPQEARVRDRRTAGTVGSGGGARKTAEQGASAGPPPSAGGLRPCRSTSPLEVGASLVSSTGGGSSASSHQSSHSVQVRRQGGPVLNNAQQASQQATAPGVAVAAGTGKPTRFQCNPRSTI